MQPKYIFVSGGVISGIGKGVITASTSLLLKSAGYKVSPVKIDMYINIDAGTIRPAEHGEIFVTDDGIETDQDIGHYERFLNESLTRHNYITTGQIYNEVIKRERSFYYQGEDVEAIPHVTDEIQRRIDEAARNNKTDIIIVELGGTVGEYQNMLFFEAARILKLKKPNDVIHIHVSYLPTPAHLGEMKSKPTQTSVKLLNSMGIQPDFLVARSNTPVDKRRQERLALFCNMSLEDIILGPTINNIYEIPIVLEKQDLTRKITKKLNLPSKTANPKEWQTMIKKQNLRKHKLKIAMVGKYQKIDEFRLKDTYISVVEAIKHSGLQLGIDCEIAWFDAEKVSDHLSELNKINGIIVPQGWGSRGVEGKISAVSLARQNKIPYLGLCFGMQMAVIEFARNAANLKNANTEEADPKTPHPVIHIMPDQEEYLKKHQYGGTIRLGSWPCKLKKGTIIYNCYKKYSKISPKNLIISERHRHRYEFNNQYKERLTKAGLVISGTSPDGKLVEAIELPASVHPFFVGTQFHPEYKSRPLSPHPIFLGFLQAALKTQ